MSDKIIQLSNSFLEVGIVPDCGASLAYFRTKGKKLFDIMRPASMTAIKKRDALGMSMFPMLPYTHRIKDGHFTYWGITRTVAPTHPLFKDPIHGDGWQAKWTVDSVDEKSVTLSYVHDKKKGFPFSYRAQIVYRLNEESLDVTLRLTNDSVLPMPCGFGLHPFFTKTPHVTTQFTTKNVWYHENDPIDRPYSTPEEYCFDAERPLGTDSFDICYGGFDEQAQIKWPKFGMGLTINADINFGHIVLFAPDRKNYFSLEPSTMANDAFNMASRGIVGTGIKSIGKDETLEGNISFVVHGLE